MSISAEQFEKLQARLARRGKNQNATPTPTTEPITLHKLLLGVDPSLRGTGYGLIQIQHGQPHALLHGTIRCPKTWPRTRCLVQICQTLRDILKNHQPTVCVVEGLFFAQNLQTTLLMGEARGAALVAVAETGLDIYEMAPRRVKQAIVGHGGAQKLAVAKMVQRLLSMPDLPEPDAADALALALAYAQEQGRLRAVPPKKL